MTKTERDIYAELGKKFYDAYMPGRAPLSDEFVESTILSAAADLIDADVKQAAAERDYKEFNDLRVRFRLSIEYAGKTFQVVRTDDIRIIRSVRLPIMEVVSANIGAMVHPALRDPERDVCVHQNNKC